MQPSQRRLSLAVLLALVLMAMPAARPAYAQTITVSNLNDIDGGTGNCGTDADGCSLREAIRLANVAGPNTISFSVSLTGTIVPATPLPDLTDNSTTIDAGAGHNIVIDGTAISEANGLTIRSNNNIIRGLVIIGFRNSGDNNASGSGIYINGGDNNQIYGNWIGVDLTGLTARDNDAYGVFLANGASGNIIGADSATDRNVLAGNLTGGVRIYNLITGGGLNQGNSIVGNYIGVNKDGTGLPAEINTNRAAAGVFVAAGSRDTTISNNVIGGFTSTITGSISAGINVTGFDASDPVSAQIPTGTVITGNYIGVSKTGVRLANRLGIRLGGDSRYGPKNTIIGDAADISKRNVIAGNTYRGIEMPDTTFTWGDATIAGNYIGLDGSGNRQPNGSGAETGAGPGIYIGLTQAATGLPIGKVTIGPGNVISANDTYGIQLRTGDHVIKGNLFGTNILGTTSLITTTANGAANIFLENGTGVLVGGPTSADRNIIAYSDSADGFSGGILITPIAASATSVSGNHTIEGNYIGVAADGSSPLNPLFRTDARLSVGVRAAKSDGNTIRGNVIGGLYQGINLGSTTTGSEANNNLIVGNKVGAPASGEIYFASRPTDAQIAAPRNRAEGIRIYRGTGNTIRSNLVAYNALVPAGSFALSAGIWVGLSTTAGTANTNTVEDNRLVRNGENNAFGIIVERSTGVRLSRNTTQFHDDTGANYVDNGIFLSAGGNGNRAAPTSLAVAPGSPPTLTGSSSCNGCTVEIFTTSLASEAAAREGPIYLTSGTTSATDGSFSLPMPVCQQYLTATVTDGSGNTSDYSAALNTGNPGPCAPLVFTLGAASPNSRNVTPGSTATYTHTLSHTAPVTLTYTVVFTSSNDWASAPALVTVPPNGQTDFVVSVRVPPDTLAGAPADVTAVQVFAGLQGSNVVTDTTTPAIVTTNPAQPAVSGPLTQPRTAATVTFSHIVTNTGDVTGTFLVSTPIFEGTPPAGWSIGTVTPSSLTLGPQITSTLEIVVNTPTIPPPTSPVTLTFQVSVQGASPPRSVSQSDFITVPVARSFSFVPTASEAVTTTAGANVSFTYTLTNTGNAVDSFSVAASPTSPLVSPPITSVVASTPALTSLAPGASAAVTVTY
ncbi:MAG: hypothetical protein HGA45_10085, partial [Chloroflexales bacterium]|nr:hypothetical protein [Chloroflexales bacterium]